SPFAQLNVDVGYSVYDVDVRFHHPLIVFDKFKIDTTFYITAHLDFNALYDEVKKHIWLPPRCIKLCVPFTNWCYEKCIDLGGISVTVPPIPISLNLAATYKPAVDDLADEFVIYPELVSPPVFIIDPVRIAERICEALASVLPWPLSNIADKFCQLFGSIFGLFEDVLAKAINILVTKFFDATGGWIGVPLRFIKIYRLDKHKFPGTNILVQLSTLEPQINSADELEARVLVHPP